MKLVLGVVDDDPLFVDLLESQWVDCTDISIVRAANGQELASLLMAGAVDCLLLDYDLGGEDGLSLTKRLRSEGFAIPPVIMMTGVGSERIAVEAFRSGVVDYVVKGDISFDSLAGTVRRAVTRSARQGEIQQGAASPIVGQQELGGLPDRANLERRLREAGSTEPRSPFAVIALRPRSYDAIQRTCGAGVALDVQRQVGWLLEELTPAGGLSGHWSAGVCVCLVEQDVSAAAVLALCDLLLDRLCFPYSADSRLLAIEVEIGAALSSGGAGSGGSTLAKAVAAMEHCDLLDRPIVTAFAVDAGTGGEAATIPSRRKPASDLFRKSAASPDSARAAPKASAHPGLVQSGRAEMGEHHAAVDCTVTRLSDRGAVIRFADVLAAPPRFRLAIPGGGVDRDVWLRWQVGQNAGIAFLDPSRGQVVTDLLPIQVELGIRFLDRTREELETVPLDASSLASEDHRAEIERLVHRIAGTAGSFGFFQIGNEARSLQHRLVQADDDNAGIAAALSRIRALVRLGARQ